MLISTKTTMLIKSQLRERWLISLTRPLCIICQPFSVEGSREQERNWFHNSERLPIKLQSRRIYSGAFNDLGRMCHRITEFTWASTNLLSEMLLQYSEQSGTSGGQTVRNIACHCARARASQEEWKAGLPLLGIITAGGQVALGNFEVLKVFKWISCWVG